MEEALTELDSLEAPLPPEQRAALIGRLRLAVQWLLEHRFERLLSLLYRVDVSEKALKSHLLRFPDEDAALLIATLLLDRQLQKIESRRSHRQEGEDCNEERW
jgi:hypothetical protein